ncbi:MULTISPECIES: hypothetical protein [unclassified Pseudomonas]|uniref:hypothetical protein n=1 Tax=unclassified Pseudomonas TaxID=196821 RepID=UPI001C60DD28|nr:MULTISPECIES: hypothetical protein [unclassified Pseudomonas]MBW5416124.1 hypothetical protein [Pseudomonas sp. MAG002Y]
MSEAVEHAAKQGAQVVIGEPIHVTYSRLDKINSAIEILVFQLREVGADHFTKPMLQAQLERLLAAQFEAINSDD